MPTFVNRYGNVRFECAEIARPDSLEAVVALVNRARAAGLRVKAVGGAHGFNNDIRTGGILVDLAAMNRVLAVDRATGRVLLQAGTTLADAIAALDAEGLHFPSLGSWSSQTIAGAIATSTHGSSLRHCTLSDIVTGVELVRSDGAVEWVSGGERLAALRTHLGQLGLVTRVEIACAPAFWLSCATRQVQEAAGFAEIVAIARTEEYASMLWLPYVGQCCIRVLTRSAATGPNDLATRAARQAAGRTRLVNTAIDVAEFAAGHGYLRAPRLCAGPYSALIRAAFREDHGVVDKSYNVFRYDKYREPTTNHWLRLIFNSEYALDVAELAPALRAVREVIAGYRRAGRVINYPRIHIRFSPASDQTLLGLNAGRDTAHVGIYIVASVRHRPQIEIARAIEGVLAERGGRPHWGKYRYDRSQAYRQTYAGWERFQAIRSELDPVGMFADGRDMFDDLDLMERPPVRAMWRSLVAADTYFPVRLL
jgi:FAD/FMN-containing dehydrogenase